MDAFKANIADLCRKHFRFKFYDDCFIHIRNELLCVCPIQLLHVHFPLFLLQVARVSFNECTSFYIRFVHLTAVK